MALWTLRALFERPVEALLCLEKVASACIWFSSSMFGVYFWMFNLFLCFFMLILNVNSNISMPIDQVLWASFWWFCYYIAYVICMWRNVVMVMGIMLLNVLVGVAVHKSLGDKYRESSKFRHTIKLGVLKQIYLMQSLLSTWLWVSYQYSLGMYSISKFKFSSS